MAQFDINSLLQSMGIGQPQSVDMTGVGQQDSLADILASLSGGQQSNDYLANYEVQEAPLIDFGDMAPMEQGFGGMGGGEEQSYAPTVPTGNISNYVQEALGAREPVKQNSIMDILSTRFNNLIPEQAATGPSVSNYITAAKKSLYGAPTTSQEIADAGVVNQMKMMSSMNKATGAGSGTVFSQVMAQINADPQLSRLPAATKIAMAQSKIGTNLIVDPNTGAVRDMGGAATGLGNLQYGAQGGKNQSNLEYAGRIAAEKKNAEFNAQLQQELNKKGVQANSMLNLINEARTYLPYATGSTLGAARVAGQKILGISTEETQANAKLDAIGGAMVSNIPRMEGPQSDKDTMLYREQAGRIADRTLPIADRAAALDVIEEIAQRQAGYGNFIGAQLGGVQAPQSNAPNLQDPGFQEFLRSKGY